MLTDLALARGIDSLASVLENVLGLTSSDLEKGPGRMNLGWVKEIMDLGLVNGMDSNSGLVLGREISRGMNGCAVESVTGQKIVWCSALLWSGGWALNRQHSYLYSINL